jgi:3-phenylpropionate/trans-cinnamate dioxygenase ferredoxin reductase subunit
LLRGTRLEGLRCRVASQLADGERLAEISAVFVDRVGHRVVLRSRSQERAASVAAEFAGRPHSGSIEAAENAKAVELADLVPLGLDVTVIDRDPPLRRLLGTWLSALVVAKAEAGGVRFVKADNGVSLLGAGTSVVSRTAMSPYGRTWSSRPSEIFPNTEWLQRSRLRTAGAIVVDQQCVASHDTVAAGDVAAIRQPDGSITGLPHWNNAVRQARTAALSLLYGRDAPIAEPDRYFWTEAFGMQIKVCGRIPEQGDPIILERDDTAGSYLVQWIGSDGNPIAAAAVNRKLPVVKLRRLATAGVGAT